MPGWQALKWQWVAQWLAQRVEVDSVYLKHRSDGEGRGKAVRGKAPKEPLRFLENGIPIHCGATPFDTVGVDTLEDVRRVEAILAAR